MKTKKTKQNKTGAGLAFSGNTEVQVQLRIWPEFVPVNAQAVTFRNHFLPNRNPLTQTIYCKIDKITPLTW